MPVLLSVQMPGINRHSHVSGHDKSGSKALFSSAIVLTSLSKKAVRFVSKYESIACLTIGNWSSRLRGHIA